ncbi:MAG: NAD-binding protein, partial [Bacteroidota bacterium]
GFFLGLYFFCKQTWQNTLIILLISLNVSETGFLIINKMFAISLISEEFKEILFFVLLLSVFLSPIFLSICKYLQKKLMMSLNKEKQVDIIVVNMNVYGENLAKSFLKNNASYLIIDSNLDRIINARSLGYRSYLGNFFQIYKQLNIEKCKLIIFTEVDENNLKNVIEIQQMYEKINILTFSFNKKTHYLLKKHEINSVRIPSKSFIKEIVNQCLCYLANDRITGDF